MKKAYNFLVIIPKSLWSSQSVIMYKWAQNRSRTSIFFSSQGPCCQICYFSYEIQQNLTVENGVKTLEIAPNCTNFSIVWHEIFPTHKHVKLHHICKTWCSIAPSGNTVQQHRCGKQARACWPDCARCILPNIYKILPNYKIIYCT